MMTDDHDDDDKAKEKRLADFILCSNKNIQ